MGEFNILKSVDVVIGGKKGKMNMGVGRKGKVWRVLWMEDGKKYWVNEMEEKEVGGKVSEEDMKKVEEGW